MDCIDRGNRAFRVMRVVGIWNAGLIERVVAGELSEAESRRIANYNRRKAKKMTDVELDTIYEDHRAFTFHQEHIHEYTDPPAAPWACRRCGRGYAHRHNGKCLGCPGLLVRVPYVEEAPDADK